MFIGGSQQFAAATRLTVRCIAASAFDSRRLNLSRTKERLVARNGYKIFDADTHVRPDADLLEPYLSNLARAKLALYENYRARHNHGAVTYLMGERKYKRRLGLAGDEEPQGKEYMSGYKRQQHRKPHPLCARETR